MDLSSVITVHNLGIINATQQDFKDSPNQYLDPVIKAKNPKYIEGHTFVVDLDSTLTQCDVIDNGGHTYSGLAHLTFTVESSSAVDLSTVITDKALGTLNISDYQTLSWEPEKYLDPVVKAHNPNYQPGNADYEDVQTDSATMIGKNIYKGNLDINYSLQKNKTSNKK